ncbi:AmmeMemoRadiSam system protein B [Spirochaeta cellobiosiphila]|uniref:AmmeMemoRadiSam system protein B n=1 Tax=Spirochaeta cellobiosiphila TaxID=504483 RepID=UPI00041657F1|nr:AmmeMemoRadiSam system protein B [Spirochaeta cellobiosiphila]
MKSLLAILPLLLLFMGCYPEGDPVWDVKGEVYPDVGPQYQEDVMNEEDFPLGGTVSHHLLAGQLIEDWFAELKHHRQVRTFFILSPRHWDMGTGDYSISDGSWQTLLGRVDSDQDLVRALSTELECEVDRSAFVIEHGIRIFMPFIKKYFPNARVVAIDYKGEPPVNTPIAAKLWSSLSPYFQGVGIQDNFLLISTDYSHHADPEYTAFKDGRSRRFLSNPGLKTWNFVGCDNRPGIYVLAELAESLNKPNISVMYHSNSYLLSGQDRDDITSYFFTYLLESSTGLRP